MSVSLNAINRISSGFDIPLVNHKECIESLIKAIKVGDLETVKKCICDLKNDRVEFQKIRAQNGTTLLHLAALTPYIEIALELIKEGLPINALDQKGRTSLEIALYAKQNEMAATLLSLGGTQEAINRKILAHIWSLKGDLPIQEKTDYILNKPSLLNSLKSDKNVKSESFKSHLIEPAFVEYTLAFFKSREFKEMKSPLDVDPIITAVQKISENQTRDPKEIAQEVLSGDLVLIHTGWNGHATSIGFYGIDVVKTNAARSSKIKDPKQAVNLFYEMSKKDDLENCIAILQKKEDRDFFNKTIDDRLGLKIQSKQIKSTQEVGNCSWASLKALFHACLSLQGRKIYSNKEERRKECLRVYKAWKYYVSQLSLNKYMWTSQDRSFDLIKAVNNKNELRAQKSKHWGPHVFQEPPTPCSISQ